ncbi:hypothetical protein L3X38_005501 [Prunus dulcis]|uniref:Uncharacterized protein n=1 Tax=Prunus dulcis TaxID=3755 RepID=A0AAD5F498_PRUDU|nr:hypothetical protein L3X38_005501 [Prunus dulcis]
MAPLPGVCKVNTDGSRINSFSLIGAGDALATKSYDFAPGLHVFLEAPAFLSDMLAADVRGAVRPHLVYV